jgi:predicted alpha/beta-hydrolase family hydrolase
MPAAAHFSDVSLDPPVRGFLHRLESPSGDSLILTHGAGGNAQMGLLVALAEAFASTGFAVLRCDLPFRQQRPYGPPRPSDAVRDREGLKNAVAAMRKLFPERRFPVRIFLGGQSYGGRQASMLVAETPVAEQSKLADGLLLLSYPLHPPAHPEKPRTQHLPKIEVPVMFVSGTRDPFGTIDEIESARKLIPAKTLLLPVEGAGHDLGFAGKKRREDLPAFVLEEFQKFFV